MFRNTELKSYEGTTGYQEQGWDIYLDGSLKASGRDIPFHTALKPGTELAAETVLTFDGSDEGFPAVFLNLNHVTARVYYDGKEVFSHTYDDVNKIDRSNSLGNIRAAVPLDHDCRGKTLRIVMWPQLSNSIMEYEIGPFYFGDYATVMHHIFISSLPETFLFWVTLFMGITLIILSICLRQDDIFKQTFYMGVFAVVFSLFSATDNIFMMFMLGNPYVTYLVNRFVFALVPMFFLMFLREKLQKSYYRTCSMIIMMGAVNFLMQGLLHGFGIRDAEEMVFFTKIYYVIAIFPTIFNVFRLRNRKLRKTILISIIPVAAALVLDGILSVFRMRLFASDSGFLKISVVILLVIESKAVIDRTIQAYRDNVEANLYKNMAYRDGLTGLYNRAEWERDIAELRRNPRKMNSIICMFVDINDLKQINDVYGHSEGDKSIRHIAEILMDSFSDYGKIFRVGGDEFIALLHGISDEKLESIIAEFRRDMENLETGFSMPLGAAAGYERLKEGKIDQCIRTAEARMYQDKRRMKDIR